MNWLERILVKRKVTKILEELMKLEMFKGKRTKILSFAILFILGGLRAADVIDDKTFGMLLAAATSAGLLTAADHDKDVN